MGNIYFLLFLIIILSPLIFSQEESNCDSLNIPDYQTNLVLIKDSIPKFVIDTSVAIVNQNINELKLFDSLFSKTNLETFLRISNHYKCSDKNLFLLGFAYTDTLNIDFNSAHIFVFGIYKENKIVYCNQMNELEGEIKMELNGYIEEGESFKLFGKAFPYFGRNYGRFVLYKADNEVSYSWECISK